ncbi:MAG: YraN family protein [Quinella sp. 3Q1]|nr:YraN family protein [Quinella sp. 3Q1]MBR6888234.1 YraN family protein [Selenomonadaceae bacterium]
MSKQKTFGKFGEDSAAKFLEAQGYTIVARNFRIRSAEIDIIARRDDVLVFVEVKARSDIRHGLPSEAVTFRKQKKIIEAAGVFLQDENFSECACRFDIVEVYLRGDCVEEINHIENAFEVEQDI